MADNIGTGFQFFREDSAGAGTYTLVAGVVSGSLPSLSREEVDVTKVSDTTRQFIAGLSSFGTFTVTLAFDSSDSTQQAFETEVVAGPTEDGIDFALYHTGMGEHWIATGFITGWAPAALTPGQYVTADLTVRLKTFSSATSGAPPSA